MSDLLTAVAIIFIVAGPFLLVANRYDLPTVPLLIVAGIVAGGFIEEELTLELAQYGIALLVFGFGVGIQLDAIRTVLFDSEIAAIGQILVLGTLGFAFGFALGVPAGESVYLGVAAALSSTIVGTALLETEIRTELVHGRLAESINFVQDLFAIGIVLVVSAEVFAADPIATQLGYGVMLLAAAVAINRYLFDLIGRLAGGSDELMIIGVVSLLVVFVGAAEIVGVSMVVGAFAAGLAVRHDPATYLGLFNGLESIKDFFVAIFFVTIGALVVLPFVGVGWTESVEKLALAGGLVLLTVIVKPAITTAILLYEGYESRTATLTSLSTDQVSEFALIIAIEALLLGLLTQSVFDAIIFAAAVTMITSSLTQRYDERIYRTLADRGLMRSDHRKVDALSDVPEDVSDHVIVIGYGRKGRRMVDTFEALERPYVVIENDPVVRDAVREECDAYVFGDAMEPYTWEKTKIDDATLIVSTTSSEVVSWRLIDFDFDAALVLHARDERTALDLLDRGVTYVAVSNLLAGERLVQHVRALLDGVVTTDELREERLLELDGVADVDHRVTR